MKENRLFKRKPKLNWNKEYILTHTLSQEEVDEAGATLLEPDEIFVEIPGYRDYYISQYGQCISLRRNGAYLLIASPGGQSDRQYLYYKMDNVTVGVHHCLALTFCPNFWGWGMRLEAHHINGNKMNNELSNIVLLPPILHKAANKIKDMVWLVDGKIKKYSNPLDLVNDTGLTLEQILLVFTDKKKKPVKCYDKYTVYDIDGFLIGFQFQPDERKRRK